MMIDWTSLLNILGHSPGDLVYHLVVGSALLLILVAALQRNPTINRSNTQKHILISASLLFALQFFLFILARLIAPAGLISPTSTGVIEALIHTLTLVWLIWSFIENDETFLITGIGIFISLALLVWGAISLVLLSLQTGFLPSENTWIFTVWDLGGIALAATGVVVMWAKRPQGWTAAIAILLVLGLGHSLPFLFADPGTFRPGTIRLAQILALPWVIILTQRLLETRDFTRQAVDQPKRTDITPLLVDELLKISHLEDPHEKNMAIARSLSLSLVSDMCFLVKLNETDDYIECLAGYDLIREQPLPKPQLARENLPNILQAWEGFRPYAPVYPPVETRDAATLREVFNYHRIGSLMAYPLRKSNQILKGGVIFLAPYTDKKFGPDAVILMENIEETLAKVLFEPGLQMQLSADLVEANQKTDQLQQKTETLSKSLVEYQTMVTDQEEQIRQLKAKYQIEKLKMVKQIDACQEKIIRLSSQAASHKQDLEKLQDLKVRIRALVTEREHLERELADANTQIEALEAQLDSKPAAQETQQNEILSLDALAANINLKFGPRCQQKGLTLDIVNPEGRQLIKTNPDQLQTLINNLLENAILASRPEGSLHFAMKLSYETGMLQLQVTDSGQGLSPEEQVALFNEMKQIPAGIGSIHALHEAIRLVQAFGGKVWLRSKQDAFTSFRVQLPVRIMD